MKNRKTMMAVVAAIGVTTLSVSTMAADILGCPNGIMKGTIWPRLSVTYADMTEKWNAQKGEMVDIEDGAGLTKKELISSNVRLGYGLSSRCDIGVELKYASVDTEKKNLAGKTASFSESGLTEIWLAGKYFIVDSHNPESEFNYTKVSLGAAFGYGVVDDDEALVAGLSAGCNKAQLGALLHGGIHDDFVEYAAHVIYEWRGDAAESDGVTGFPFKRSGQDVPDVVNYQMVVEKTLGRWFEMKLGAGGWMSTQKDDTILDGTDEQYTYSHNVLAGIQFYPMTTDYSKRKIVLQGTVPYASRTGASPDYTVNCIAMWTF